MQNKQQRNSQLAKQAIKAAGGYRKLANKLVEHFADSPDFRDITVDQMYWRVEKWASKGIHHDFVPAVATITGLPRAQIRPDLYEDAA